MSDATPTPPPATGRRWVAPGATVVAATVLNALCLPVWFLLVLAFGRYDASGEGGPFRSCTLDSISCEGPNLSVIGLVSLALVAIAVLAGWLGARVGRRTGRRAVLRLGGLALLAMIVEAGAFFALILTGIV